MEQILGFYTQYGWQLALIALLGIIILGVLKYANVFKKVEKEKRKPIYFGISMGFSVLATIVYLLIIKQFSFDYVVAVTTAIYALNQGMYAVYETTNLRDLLNNVFKFVVKNFKKPEEKNEQAE